MLVHFNSQDPLDQSAQGFQICFKQFCPTSSTPSGTTTSPPTSTEEDTTSSPTSTQIYTGPPPTTTAHSTPTSPTYSPPEPTCPSGLSCANDGTLDPNTCKCICPEGLSQDTNCEELDVATGVCRIGSNDMDSYYLQVADTEVCISSSNYTDGDYEFRGTCNFEIKAQTETCQIQYYFKSPFDLYCSNLGNCEHYLQISDGINYVDNAV
ncbi:hypothetical protein CAPTEDRAFT_189621, partial [Capitella teleta]